MQPADDSWFFKLRGKTWIAMSKIDRERTIEQCFQFWRERGFPYDQLTPDQMASDFAGVTVEFIRALQTRKRASESQELRVSLEGIALKTSLHGTFLLVIAMVFYYLFLKFVYPITVVPT